MGVAGAYLVSPDGKSRKMFTDRSIPSKIAEGWSVAPGQSIGTESESGLSQRITGESYEAQLKYGDSRPMVPSDQMHDEAVEAERSRKYSGRTGEALLAGAFRGGTLGFGDSILTGLGIAGSDTLKGLQDHNTTASTVGEISTMLASGIGATGKGLVGQASRLLPSGKIAAQVSKVGAGSSAKFVAASAAEAGLYGLGDSVSQISVHDEELTAGFLTTNILQHAALGGVGAGVFAAGSKVVGGIRKAAKGKPKPIPEFDATTREGNVYLGEASRQLGESISVGDDLLRVTDPKFGRSLTPGEDEMLRVWETRATGQIDDVIKRADGRIDDLSTAKFTEPVNPTPKPDFEGHAKKIESLEDEVNSINNGISVAKDGKSTPLAPRTAGAGDNSKRIAEIEEELRVGDAIYAKAKADGTKHKGVKPKNKGNKAEQAAYDAEREAYRSFNTILPGGRNKFSKQQMTKLREELAGLKTGHQSLAQHMEVRTADTVLDEVDALIKNPPEVKVNAKKMAKYEKDLAKYHKDVADNADEIEALGDAVNKLAHRRTMMKSAKTTKAGQEASHGERISLASDTDISGDLSAVRRMIGDSGNDIADFNREISTLVGKSNEIMKRISAPVPGGTKWARDEYASSMADLKRLMGYSKPAKVHGRNTTYDIPESLSPNTMAMSKALNGTPEGALEFGNAMTKHYQAIQDMAQVARNPQAVEAAIKSLGKMKKHMDSALPKGAVEATEGMDLKAALAGVGLSGAVYDVDGPFDNIIKASVIYAMLRQGKGAKVDGLLGSAAESTSGKAPGMLSKLTGAFGGGSARMIVPGSGILGGGGRAVAGYIGNKAGGKLAGANTLFRASGAAASQVGQAVNRMVKGTVKAGMGATGAAAMMKALKLSEESDKKSKEKEESLQKLFKKKRDALLKLTGNPQALAERMYEFTADLRAIHPTVGDKVEVGLGEKLKYIANSAPKDPGTSHSMGVSTWAPDDFEIHKWGQVIQGVMDPMSVVDGVTDNSISMIAAKAFRDTDPVLFNKLGVELAHRSEELQESLHYDQLNNLAILMGQPMGSVTEDDYVKFVVASYTTAKTNEMESMGNVDSNALINGTPTQAQQLLKRGTE